MNNSVILSHFERELKTLDWNINLIETNGEGAEEIAEHIDTLKEDRSYILDVFEIYNQNPNINLNPYFEKYRDMLNSRIR